MFQLMPLIILLPMGGLLVNLIYGRRQPEPVAGIIASGAAGLAFIGAVIQAIAVYQQPTGTILIVAQWWQVGQFSAPLAFQIDTLAVVMMLVVTGVGTLIHIYSLGYMQGDESFARFFIYLNLFLTAMLLLVTADNYLLLFVGWEGVGLCSYLLIGFWFDRGAGGTGNATAARKAFVVNRIGDFGLILAMILMFWQFGTVTFRDVFAQIASIEQGAPIITAITLLLLVGAIGKSAQIPLFIWLPDAMAGPTPASALIHAATMVTAGIYMMVRSHLLFELAPLSQTAVTVIGTATALFAATIAIGQYDIKRVLAYSTISQLGFMVAAVGLGAYVAAIFHLVTHAFFKALLFLAAGSVIHGVEHGAQHNASQIASATQLQDMRQMGGLWRRMPWTFAVYLVGALALAGLPPLAGFFSKDEILAAASAHNLPIFEMLTAAALGTAFYMGRQLWLVFGGQARSEAAAQAQESQPVMIIPMVGLAMLALLGGLLNWPGYHALGHWLAHTLGEGETAVFNPTIALTSTLLALFGGGLAWLLYGRQPAAIAHGDPLADWIGTLFVVFNQGWWIDEAYTAVVIRPYRQVSLFFAKHDEATFASLERLVVRVVRRGTAVLRRTQTGQFNWNVVGIVVGLLVTLLFLGTM